jgi:hypothetical protein
MISVYCYNSINMRPSEPQKTFPIVLRAEDIVFSFSFLGTLCDVIPCSVPLFPGQGDETILCHPSRRCEESNFFDSINF